MWDRCANEMRRLRLTARQFGSALHSPAAGGQSVAPGRTTAGTSNCPQLSLQHVVGDAEAVLVGQQAKQPKLGVKEPKPMRADVSQRTKFEAPGPGWH